MSYEQITIPSCDQTELEVRLYASHPGEGTASDTGKAPARVAVIAHPYGFLGGSMHDHVVQALKDTLCRNGIKVLLYNSRGVGRSRGRASWTGEPERKDYQAVTDWLISTEAKLIRTEAKLLDTEVKEVGDSTVHTRKTLEVFCCGYSYGSLMASCALHSTSTPANIDLDMRYILISPPLSNFIGFLLTPFRSGQFMKALQGVLSHEVEQSAPGQTQGKVLIAYGTRDTFTQAETYRSQIQKLVAQPGVRAKLLSVVEVPGADHFWADPQHKLRLITAVSGWL